MQTSDHPTRTSWTGGSVFPTTQWTVLLKPLTQRQSNEEEALQRLFEIYRPAIVAFIRAREKNEPSAEDIAHEFILKLLRHDDLARLDRSKGRFRSFLVASIKHFLASYHAAQKAQKRGGQTEPIAWEAVDTPPADYTTAETLFLRRWVSAVNEEVLRRLRGEWQAAGKGDELTHFEPFLEDKQGAQSRAALGAQLGLSVNAINVRIVRLRERYRTLMREVIAETVGGPDEVDEEIRFLLTQLTPTGTT